MLEEEPIPVLDTVFLLDLLLGRVPMAPSGSGIEPEGYVQFTDGRAVERLIDGLEQIITRKRG